MEMQHLCACCIHKVTQNLLFMTLYTCQPIQFTSIKYSFFHYFGEIWPYWKMDTEKRNFHEILLLLSKKDDKTLKWAADTCHHQMHTDWPSAIG